MKTYARRLPVAASTCEVGLGDVQHALLKSGTDGAAAAALCSIEHQLTASVSKVMLMSTVAWFVKAVLVVFGSANTTVGIEGERVSKVIVFVPAAADVLFETLAVQT